MTKIKSDLLINKGKTYDSLPVSKDGAIFTVNPCNHFVVSTVEGEVLKIAVHRLGPVARFGRLEILARNPPTSIFLVATVETVVETNQHVRKLSVVYFTK